MRSAIVIGLFLVSGGAGADPNAMLESLEPKVFEAQGSARESASRARVCVIKLVKNDAFQISDSSESVALPGNFIERGNSTSVAGGDVLVTFDSDAGLVVANSRITIPGGLGGMMGRESIKSLITVEAKEGRFRIGQSGIARATSDTGSYRNSGYGPVYIRPMTGHAKIKKALEELSEKLGACVKSSADSNW